MVTESGCSVILGNYSHSQQTVPELWVRFQIQYEPPRKEEVQNKAKVEYSAEIVVCETYQVTLPS